MSDSTQTKTSLPKLRRDLVVSRQGESGGTIFVVKDSNSGRFFRFRNVEGFILQQLDGTTSLDTVRAKVEAEFGAELSPEVLGQFINKLHQLGLLEEEKRQADGGRRPPLQRRRVRGDLFYLRFPAFDPDSLFDRWAGRVRFLFTPWFVTISAALILCAAGTTVANWDEIVRDFHRLFNVQSVLVAWATMFAVIVAHECAHGLTCKQFGGQVHEMGFMLIYFQPAFYCNVSDAWLFAEKSKRLWVTFAGAYFELFLWALATLAWRVTDPGTGLSYIALIVMATSGIKSLFNLNPLIKLDGYYLLSDYLEIPNLRQKAFNYLGDLIKTIGRARPPGAPPNARLRRTYLIYGILAATYSYWLLAMVLVWFGGLMVRRYQGWGFVVFVVALGLLFHRPLASGFAKLRGVSNSTQGVAARIRKLATLSVGLAVVVAGLYFVQTDLRVAGEFKILPVQNADVRAEVEGIIEQVLVDEGDTVNKGDVIARLADRDYRAELRETGAEIDERQARLRMLRAGPRTEEIELARTAVQKGEERLKYGRNQLDIQKTLYDQGLASRKDLAEAEEEAAVRAKELEEAQGKLRVLLAGSRPEEIEGIEAEIARLTARRSHLEDQLQRTTIASPIAGVITTLKLKEKVGAHVIKGDLIAVVHQLKTVTAEISVSEKEISDVRVGQIVLLKARAYPETSFHGEVTAIAPIARQQVADQPARTIRVVTRLDNSALLLKPEMTGNAKIICGKRRLIDLVTRRIARYIRVEFWSWW